MRDLILKMSVSIDGFVGGPAGELDWIFATPDDRATAWTVASVSNAGVHVMGSRTFADMAAYWPTATGPFAAPMNDIPKVVFARGGAPAATTRALEQARQHSPGPTAEPTARVAASWRDARVAAGPLADEVARLKAEPGQPIFAHGGSLFAQSLVRADLVDEYRLLVHPVALGRGKPLFASLDARRDLALVDLQRFDAGTVALVYRRR
jgi:dihydrofolate reductase|nr:dihydrofolate reductase family protein [Kofleriaceae bacterium]